MFVWLSDLLEKFADLIPVPVVVRTDEIMVESVLGRHHREYTGKLVVQWDLLAEYEYVKLGRQSGDSRQEFYIYEEEEYVPRQVTVTFGWKCIDATQMVIYCDNYYHTIQDIVKITLSEMCEEGELPVAEDLMKETNKKLTHYGMRITDLGLTSKSPVQALKISGMLNTSGHLE